MRPIYLRRRCIRHGDPDFPEHRREAPPRVHLEPNADPPPLRQVPQQRIQRESPFPDWRANPSWLEGMELYVVGNGDCLHLASCHTLTNRTSGTAKRLYLCRHCVRDVPAVASVLLWQGTTLHHADPDLCPHLDRYSAARRRLCRSCWSGRLPDASFQEYMA